MAEQQLRHITRRLLRAMLSPRNWVARRILRKPPVLIRLGSSYGGWNIVGQAEIAGAANLLCGAGEDLSFDLALQRQYDCHVVIIDPTPRAVQHWHELKAALADGRPFAINQGAAAYEIEGVDFDKINFLPYAVWIKDMEVTFWTPANATHVSHSIVNLQGTRDNIKVEARTLPRLIALSNAGLPLGILKLDIEGAAVDVLEDLLVSDLRPMQILAEFEELTLPTPSSFARFKSLIGRLRGEGYLIAAFDGHANITFWRSTT